MEPILRVTGGTRTHTARGHDPARLPSRHGHSTPRGARTLTPRAAPVSETGASPMIPPSGCVRAARSVRGVVAREGVAPPSPGLQPGALLLELSSAERFRRESNPRFRLDGPARSPLHHGTE